MEPPVTSPGMRGHYKLFLFVMRHKWAVFKEAWKLGLYIHAFTHDLSKFLPSEWLPSVRFYFGDGDMPRDGRAAFRQSDPAFNRNTLLHIHRNPHHWQHWIFLKDNGDLVPVEIPEKYRRQLLADWRGAAKVKGNILREYYTKATQKEYLAPDTRAWMDDMILHRPD